MTGSWAAHNPKLQLAWDATSLGALQKCPRYYQYNIVEGLRAPDNPHLDFGGMFQEAVEVYQLARLAGRSLHEAEKAMLLRALQISGSYLYQDAGVASWEGWHIGPTYSWVPWGGDYVQRWRCTGTEPYKNEKGRKAKCPYSHAGKWFPLSDESPSYWHAKKYERCVTCDSPVEAAEHYIPDHPSKHRRNLIKALLLFASRQTASGGFQPFAFPDGTPSIEVNVTVPMGRKAPGRVCVTCGGHGWIDGKDYSDGSYSTGRDCRKCNGTGVIGGDEDYLLVENLDEINTWRGRHWLRDNKTTKDPLNARYFRQFAPHAQFDHYDVVTSIALPDLDAAGLIVYATQVTKEQVDAKTAWITKTQGQREEYWRDLHYWLDQAERFAAEGYWPMNRASCKGCEFAPFCDMDPAMRQQHLDQHFVRRGSWDPLNRPGRRVTGQEEEEEI